MRKSWFIVFITAAALLAACTQAKTTPTQTSASPTPTSQAEKAVATENPNTPKMDCQVVSLEPTQGPTEVSMFPPPSKDDWALGKDQDVPLTIIEYSDFQ
jgi:hypothetical protein